MEKNQNEIDVLNELNKGTCIGRDAIHYIIDKVDNRALRKELDIQYAKYEAISERIHKIYPKYEDNTPDKNGIMNKVMM